MPIASSRRAPRRGFSFALLACAALLSLLLSACGGDTASFTPTPAPAATVAPFPYTLTDGTGTKVTLDTAPQRIVSYSPAATEVLYAIGAGAQVVGVDRFSNYPPENASLRTLEYSKPAPEPALALKPDLVIVATRQEPQIAQFRSLGLRVVLFREPTDLPGVFAQIREIGRLTGHTESAEQVAATMERRLEVVKTKIAPASAGPRVFYELTPDGYTVSSKSFVGNMLTTLKATSVAPEGASAFPQMSAEAVIKSDPEVIVLADGENNGGQSPATVRARAGWASIAAVKNNRVHVVDADIVSRPGPRIIEAVESLARIFYPELMR